MIDYLDIDYRKDFTLIEPAVGEGHILSIIIEKYFLENLNKKTSEKEIFLENNIAGFDIRESAIEKCLEKLNCLSRKYLSKEINWNIRTFDALDRDNLKTSFSSFDYVISNPPYVSRHNMDVKTISSLREKSLFCTKFNFDLYYYFFEIGFDLWNKKGKIVYITPNSYIKARSGEIMMKYLIDNSLIETIIDYEDELKFEGANTYTAITVFSLNNTSLKVKNNKDKTIIEVSYRDLIEKYRYMVYSHKFLTDFQSDYVSLGEFTEIRNGLATLQDKTFIINENEILNETSNLLSFKKNNEKYIIEFEGVRRVIRVSNTNEKKYVIFPYTSSNEKKTSYIKIDDIKGKYPKINDYLQSSLNTKFKEKYGVYFGRTQGFTSYYDSKLVIPKVASLEDDVVFRTVGEGFILAGISIKLKEKYLNTDLSKILDYLNSKEVRKYLNIISKNYAAGYKSISSTDLKRIKVPKKIVIKRE